MDDASREDDDPSRLSAETVALQKRLNTANLRLRVAEEKRLAVLTDGELRDRVETEERKATDEEAVFTAEGEHGAKRIRVVETDFGCVIVKRPNPVHYKRFRDRESAKTADLEKLVRPCLVYPDASAFDRMLDEAPATLDRVADAVVHLAGFRAKEVSGK